MESELMPCCSDGSLDGEFDVVMYDVWHLRAGDSSSPPQWAAQSFPINTRCDKSGQEQIIYYVLRLDKTNTSDCCRDEKRLCKLMRNATTQFFLCRQHKIFMNQPDPDTIGNAPSGPPTTLQFYDSLGFRRKNPGPLQNRYLTATYECHEGYQMKNGKNDRLFCSGRRWVGTKPKCIKMKGKFLTPVLCKNQCS